MIYGGTIEPDWPKVPRWRTIEFPTHSDQRGSLSVAEVPHMDPATGAWENMTAEHLPFIPQRVYWLHDLKRGESRGAHATFQSEQIIIPVAGAFTLSLEDQYHTQQIRLEAAGPEQPARGVHLMGGVWRDLSQFTFGTVVLCLSSTRYEDTQYVRSYRTFLQTVGKEVGEKETETVQ